MDTLAAELMEWEEISLEDLKIFERGTHSGERHLQDSLIEQVPRQIQKPTIFSAELPHCLRCTLAPTLQGDPLRRAL